MPGPATAEAVSKYVTAVIAKAVRNSSVWRGPRVSDTGADSSPQAIAIRRRRYVEASDALDKSAATGGSIATLEL